MSKQTKVGRSPKHEIYNLLTKRGWEYSTSSVLGEEIYTYKQPGQRVVTIVYYPDVGEWDFIQATGKSVRSLRKFLVENQY